MHKFKNIFRRPFSLSNHFHSVHKCWSVKFLTGDTTIIWTHAAHTVHFEIGMIRSKTMPWTNARIANHNKDVHILIGYSFRKKVYQFFSIKMVSVQKRDDHIFPRFHSWNVMLRSWITAKKSRPILWNGKRVKS